MVINYADYKTYQNLSNDGYKLYTQYTWKKIEHSVVEWRRRALKNKMDRSQLNTLVRFGTEDKFGQRWNGGEMVAF